MPLEGSRPPHQKRTRHRTPWHVRFTPLSRRQSPEGHPFEGRSKADSTLTREGLEGVKGARSESALRCTGGCSSMKRLALAGWSEVSAFRKNRTRKNSGT
jgi:hypothetical protein